MDRNLEQFDLPTEQLKQRMREALRHPVQLLTLQSVGFSTVYQNLYCDLTLWKSDCRRDSAELAQQITANFQFLNALLDDDGVTNHDFFRTV